MVELTVALHYVFNAPADPIIWDVSHQVYPHKILTGGGTGMHTLRKSGGLSSRKRKGVGVRQIRRRPLVDVDLGGARDGGGDGAAGARAHPIAVIGDGAITGGMAYEAMNNAPYLNSRVIVIYNDQPQVSLPAEHEAVSELLPSQCPLTLQVRYRVCVPLPHEVEHEPYEPQLLQPQVPSPRSSLCVSVLERRRNRSHYRSSSA